MAKYVIDEEILQRLANAIREVSGTDRSYTPEEMVDAVSTILENGVYILVDENGNEVPAVFVDNEQVFTATANDIRIGTTAVTEKGVTEGTKIIPAYYMMEGMRVITAGKPFVLEWMGTEAAFTKLQALFCTNSVSTDKVCINMKVYEVNTTNVLSEVIIDTDNQKINFGLTNEGTKPYVIRYFTYREEY